MNEETVIGFKIELFIPTAAIVCDRRLVGCL